MGKRVMWTDDLDGSDIGEDASPVKFSVGGRSYEIYLNEKNHEKFLNFLGTYMEKATEISSAPPKEDTPPADTADRAAKAALNKKARTWAQATGFKYQSTEKDDKGNFVMRTIGDRGQIPPAVMEAYKLANPDD